MDGTSLLRRCDFSYSFSCLSLLLMISFLANIVHTVDVFKPYCLAASAIFCLLSTLAIISRLVSIHMTATASSDVVQSGSPIFDDFFQHLWPYIGNNTANVVFQMVKRLWLIRIDQ
ncbi:hypothetical protein TNCV_2242981 [Trichonephila clavipes]|nr:hypothetical protein TNCV_2242981 [Trichonephila clavipes]